jgi:membrane-associated phospholipid phosphatase
VDFTFLELLNSLRGQSFLLEGLMQNLSNNLFGLFLAFFVVPYFFYRSQAKFLWIFIFWILTIGVTDFSANLLKSFFLDFRPCFSDYSYLLDHNGYALKQCSATLTGMPSNHSANFFAGSLFLLTIFKINRYSLIFLLVSISVAISRVYLGKHFPLQVLAGAAYGAFLGALGGYVYLKIFSKSSLD